MHGDSSTHHRLETSARRGPIGLSVQRAAPLAIVAALAVLGGCASIPRGRFAVDSIRIVGARAVDPGAILDRLATAPNPKLFGLVAGWGSGYSIYDASVLQRDLARVERFYRGRGFFEAHARVGRVERSGADHVRIEIVVDEGTAVSNGEVRVDGLDGVPPAVADAVRAAARAALPAGSRFDEDAYKEASATVSAALTERAYAYASVRSSAQVDLAAHSIAYTFTVVPGVTAVYGPITFEGLDPDGAGPAPQEISDRILRRVMHLRPGRPYSSAEVRSAEQALLDLEVFSAAHVDPQLGDPSATVIPLVVRLEPTKLRALRLGGGAEFDPVKTDLHLLAGWENHNFLGDLRDFSVDLSPGVVLYPLDTANLVAPTNVFFEEKLRLQLRQPGFLEPRTTAFVRPEFNVYPLLVVSNPSPDGGVIGYIEPKGSVGVERRFGKHFFASLVYNVQAELPFREKTAICRDARTINNVDPAADCQDPLPPSVVLLFPQVTAQVDFKDDPIHPHAGFGASFDAQFATPPGTATDVRIQPEVEAYIPLGRRVTFALNGALGLLFPIAGYNGYVQSLGNEPSNLLPPTQNTNNERDIETVYFRGFFGGGPSDNRGYPLRGVAPHGWVPFLNPASAAAQVQTTHNTHCVQDPTTKNLASNTKLSPTAEAPNNPICFSPIGGFTMWRASAEVRVAVSGPLGVAAFCDIGDVSQSLASFRFRYLHMSCGAGLRYDTPVGPLRLDLAYRLPYLQLLGCANQSETLDPSSKCHGDPTFGLQPELFGLIPMALAFGIGEAF
jgi:outer membrane protein insertion porin family/translocation and assembly module TamA